MWSANSNRKFTDQICTLRDYDYGLDYRITSITSTGIADKQYSYDAAANIDEIADGLASNLSRSFGYDDLHRLTFETLPLNDYTAKVLAHNPVAYWRFGEIVGSTAYDSSGNGYDIAYNDTYTLGEPGLTGDRQQIFAHPDTGCRVCRNHNAYRDFRHRRRNMVPDRFNGQPPRNRFAQQCVQSKIYHYSQEIQRLCHCRWRSIRQRDHGVGRAGLVQRAATMLQSGTSQAQTRPT